MTDHGNEQPRGKFSWLRSIVKLRWPWRQITRGDRDLELQTMRAQIDIIRRAFDEPIGVASGGSADDADAEFLFHPERCLMLRENVEQVQRFFDERQDTYRGSGDSLGEPADGLMLYLLPPRHRDGQVDVLDTLDEMDREIGEGIATPDHILYVVGKPGSFCPANEPLLPPTSAPLPAVHKNPDAGLNVRVSVVDTGWYPDAATDSDSPWLASGVDGDVEQVNPALIHEYAGHGTFVAGVVRCMAPAAPIEIEGALTKGGAVYESDITQQLNEAMSKYKDDRRTPEFDPRPPQLISISAGTYSRKDLGLLGFQVLSMLYKFDQDGGPLVVAAAGNDSTQAPFWPAAFDWVLGVGSLDADGKRSTFSNYGRWVDVWAQGSKLVNAYPSGTYRYVEPKSPLFNQTRDFTGLAEWSGTSFSTPVVTGAIAALMSEKGMTARQARDALKAAAPIKQDQYAGNMKALGPPFM